MAKLSPVDWKTLERIFEADGWQFKRQSASHRAYVKEGFSRPVIIPIYSEVGVDIITNNMRTAKMTRERYLELLQNG